VFFYFKEVRQLNIIDSIIESIVPIYGEKRRIARERLNLKKFVNSGYDESGASRNKNSMKGWRARSKSPQEDIDKNLSLLRQRSRSLYMSAPLAVSAVKTNRTNIIGSGLKPKPKIDFERLGMTVDEAEAWEKKTEKEFALWAESKFCDSTKVNDFYEMQQLACMNWLLNGDACVLIDYEKNKNSYMPYFLRLRLIESDRICNPDTAGMEVDLRKKAKNGNRIYNGVEINSTGGVEAYYICNTYPISNLTVKKEWVRVKAYGKKTGNPNVLMIFESERPEQYRGVPYLAPVVESLKQLTRYAEAELMSAVLNGIFSVFIKTTAPTSEIPLLGGIGDDEEISADPNDYELGTGNILALNVNESLEIVDGKRPNINFDGFVASMAKYIGAALEIPVEILIKSFNSNYSASRAALLEFFKAVKMKRNWLVNDFCKPVYELWLTEAVAKGRITAPGFFSDPAFKKAWCGCIWNGPAQGQIDPVKEVTAAQKRVELGISTREIEAIETMGGDFMTNAVQLEREAKEMRKISDIGSDINA